MALYEEIHLWDVVMYVEEGVFKQGIVSWKFPKTKNILVVPLMPGGTSPLNMPAADLIVVMSCTPAEVPYVPTISNLERNEILQLLNQILTL